MRIDTLPAMRGLMIASQLMASHRPQEQTAAIQAAASGVSPNHPCPCGSDRKFKRCHGRQR